MIRILHISDTHDCHRRLRNLPSADVLVHSGDFTMNGSEQEALDFLNWFCDLDYVHKICIAGNHDACLFGATLDGLSENVHYLCNSGVEINGLKFYGVPMFMEDCISERQNQFYDDIPADTDVLITHAPAYGILDFDGGINYGSENLLTRIGVIQPRLHLFGHIHAQHGTLQQDGSIFSNAAIMDCSYDTLNTPNLHEL